MRIYQRVRERGCRAKRKKLIRYLGIQQQQQQRSKQIYRNVRPGSRSRTKIDRTRENMEKQEELTAAARLAREKSKKKRNRDEDEEPHARGRKREREGEKKRDGLSSVAIHRRLPVFAAPRTHTHIHTYTRTRETSRREKEREDRANTCCEQQVRRRRHR